MPVTSAQIQSLAYEIAEQRAVELEYEFYQEVTYATFHKWFEVTAGHKRPYFKRGVYFRDGKYFMIRRSKVPFKKVGKNHFQPSRQEYYRQYDLAEKLMDMGIASQKIITKNGDTLTMKLGYSDKVPNEYKGFYLEYEGQTPQERHYVMKNGKMSSLDKLLIHAIHEWAHKEGLRINIESIYKDNNP